LVQYAVNWFTGRDAAPSAPVGGTEAD
jgi:hypothetical protein